MVEAADRHCRRPDKATLQELRKKLDGYLDDLETGQ